VEQIVGADLVLARHGEVHSLPLVAGYSTTAIAERFSTPTTQGSERRMGSDIALGALADHEEVMRAVAQRCGGPIDEAGRAIIAALVAGHRLLLCGNGGSAADAEHIA